MGGRALGGWGCINMIEGEVGQIGKFKSVTATVLWKRTEEGMASYFQTH